MRRTTALSFASALLAGVAAVALTPPDAAAQQMQQYEQQMQQYERSNTNPYDAPNQGGPGDYFARHVYDQGQFGRDQQGRYGSTPYGQSYRQYGQNQQYGEGQLQQRYAGDAYGRAYRGPQGFDDYAMGQPGSAEGQDYRGPRGSDTYDLGQDRYAPGQMRQTQQLGYRQLGPEGRYPSSAYNRDGQYGRMAQQPNYAYSWAPEETYVREARRDATGVPVPEQVLVTSATDLVGRTVRDMNGESAGRVEYIMVDARSGDISYAILGEGQGLRIGTDYVAVPWSAVAVQPGDERSVSLTVSRDRVKQAPRLSADELAALASPAVLTRITRFYAPPAEQTAGAQTGQGSDQLYQKQIRQVRQSFRQAARALLHNKAQPALDGLGQITRSLQQAMLHAGDAQEQQLLQVQEFVRQARQAVQEDKPRQAQKALRRAWQPFRQILQAAAQPQTEQTGQATRQAMQTGESSSPVILVGRRAVVTLQAPALLAPAQLRGNAVVAPDGALVGTIDQVMLDLNRDHVAYLLLARGGFLGMDEVWIPVPFGSLDWSSEALSYVLNVSPQQLAAMPVLHKEELPTHVSSRHLAMLYRHYGVTPYWQEPTTAVQSAGMSPDKVREMLRSHGFTGISDLVRDGKTYGATASMNGRQYNLEIDARNGIVFARGSS